LGEKTSKIKDLFESKRKIREEKFGWHVQPVEE